MKKSLLTLFLLLTAVVSRAYDFEVDGIRYRITSAKELTVGVTHKGYGMDGYSGSVVIPESVTCNGVTYSVTSVVEGAFDGCSSLTSVIIPNSVTAIGEMTFLNCSSLERIVVAAANSVYDSRDNSNAIIETSSNKLISGCKNTVIPNSVKKIGEWAFCGCRGLTSITIPNSVTRL
ncbi:MAG: leucine-rich repeat domain-containing protein [Bacteroidaceae bacterium]|nr:leucine-rich repeat domain-containing protein [Bacteroidaceae bacterium]